MAWPTLGGVGTARGNAANASTTTSALFSIRHCEESRQFYDRKRAEGKRHTQAVLALARRRVNVLWALLRDRRRYKLIPQAIAA